MRNKANSNLAYAGYYAYFILFDNRDNAAEKEEGRPTSSKQRSPYRVTRVHSAVSMAFCDSLVKCQFYCYCPCCGEKMMNWCCGSHFGANGNHMCGGIPYACGQCDCNGLCNAINCCCDTTDNCCDCCSAIGDCCSSCGSCDGCDCNCVIMWHVLSASIPPNHEG